MTGPCYLQGVKPEYLQDLMVDPVLLGIIAQVRNLFTDRSHWTQGQGARKADGGLCRVKSPEAVCWCLTGAIAKFAANNHQAQLVMAVLGQRARDRGYADRFSLLELNDFDGYEAVMTVLA